MVLAFAPVASARGEFPDPIGDLIGDVAARVGPFLRTIGLKATLYHLGVRGIRDHDSLGCKVVPMRTAAVDGVDIKRRTVLFIKETVGLPLPGGGAHDGYWYASDLGGGIHKGRIDLFTGAGASSMHPMAQLNMATLTVTEVGPFSGCPGETAAPRGPDHGGDAASAAADRATAGDRRASHIFGRDFLAQ
jgi:3D (Asp-Asp-Asp) domain-containing protein